MTDFSMTPSTAFEGDHCLARGTLAEVALAVQAAQRARSGGAFLTFDDTTGKVIDLDLRGSDDDVHRRLRERGDLGVQRQQSDAVVAEKAAGRGRPKLGVLAREVTLLPRHWDWLAAQPGGASQTLRRLVDQAREAGEGKTVQRAAQEACYRFMSALAGDFPHFEEAARALFANDLKRLAQIVDSWPKDVRDYALALADGAGLRLR